VATCLKYGGNCNGGFIARFLESVPVKEFVKMVSTFVDMNHIALGLKLYVSENEQFMYYNIMFRLHESCVNEDFSDDDNDKDKLNFDIIWDEHANLLELGVICQSHSVFILGSVLFALFQVIIIISYRRP